MPIMAISMHLMRSCRPFMHMYCLIVAHINII
jgi:hypothetical protein